MQLNFLKLSFYSENLLNSLSSNSCLEDYLLGSSEYKTMPHTNRKTFFPSFIFSFSFSRLIFMVCLTSTPLNERGKSECLCLIFNLR